MHNTAARLSLSLSLYLNTTMQAGMPTPTGIRIHTRTRAHPRGSMCHCYCVMTLDSIQTASPLLPTETKTTTPRTLERPKEQASALRNCGVIYTMIIEEYLFNEMMLSGEQH